MATPQEGKHHSSKASSKRSVRGSGHSPSDGSRDIIATKSASVIQLLQQTFADLQRTDRDSPAGSVVARAPPNPSTPLMSPRPSTPGLTVPTTVDVTVMTRCIIVNHRELAKGKLIMETIMGELMIGGKAPVGALRFLIEWVNMRYSEDFRHSDSLRRRLYKIVMMRLSIPDVNTELSRLKLLLFKLLLLSANNTRKQRLGMTSLNRRQESLVKTASGDTKKSAGGPPPAPIISSTTTPGSPSPPPPESPATSMHKVMAVKEFMSTDSQLIARHMLYVGFEAIRMVKLPDLKAKGKGPDERGPTVNAYVDRFNRISAWVATMILSQKKPRAMKLVIIKFLEIAQFSYTFNDFSTCFAIMTAIELREVDRLRNLVWKIPPNVKAMAARVYSITSMEGNYPVYRSILKETMDDNKPCVIHLGVTTRDLTFCGEGNPTFDESGNVNKGKLMLETQILEVVTLCQSRPPEGYNKFAEKRTESLYRLLLELPGKNEKEREALSAVYREYKDIGGDTSQETRLEESSSALSQLDATSQASSKSDDASTQSEDFVDM